MIHREAKNSQRLLCDEIKRYKYNKIKGRDESP